MDNERDRTVAVLRAMDRAFQELDQGPNYYDLRVVMIAISKRMRRYPDRWNNSGLPADEDPPIRDEEWQS